MTNIDNPTSSNPGMSSIPPFSGSLLSLIPWVKSRYNKNVKYGPQKNTNTTHGKKTAAARFGVKTCCLQDLHDKWDICTWKQADWFGGISVINRVQYTSCWWKISGVYQLPCKISSYLQGLILVKWFSRISSKLDHSGRYLGTETWHETWKSKTPAFQKPIWVPTYANRPPTKMLPGTVDGSEIRLTTWNECIKPCK